jgi:hypothetical protein
MGIAMAAAAWMMQAVLQQQATQVVQLFSIQEVLALL